MKGKSSNVTAIIPCYNDGQYIMEALQSLYKQTLLPEKIIVVDDGSDAKTQKTLKSITHPLLEVVFQENRGVSAARNHAVSLAKTDYIVNLDADDYYEPSFIEKAVAILIQDNNAIAVSSYCRTFKEHKTIEIIKPLGGNLKDFIVINNGRASTMFRKQSWEIVGGFDEKMQAGYEDWEFWIAILKQGGSIHIIKEVLSHYRIKKVSRDQIALKNNDFELRQYIYLKHKEVYERYMDFYVFQLLRQNSLLRNSIHKAKKSKEYILGEFFLQPLRIIKKIFTN
ncbi:glycosyltransferase family 2 protein [Flavobacterium nitratireducens]|uniref:glycosyltransferase family 2 protein n=1 Tax=Flavobacterium nitratireducens TaxID=992289 RepID=UPI002414D0CB|nr:glycosyltransferase family A protein [Flavobacterium nitratireducens]